MSVENALNAVLDTALKEKGDSQPKRTYLGGSRLGVGCLRKLWFEYNNYPKDKGKEFNGRTYRIFERGHKFEEVMIGWLEDAGFKLGHTGEDQLGFEDGNIKGHADGVIVESPISEIKCPALWEHKTLGFKSWTYLSNRNLKEAKTEYWIQMQVYMHKMNLQNNPALFTALNSDDMQIYSELIPYDKHAAERAIEGGMDVLRAKRYTDLPMAPEAPDCFLCKWCDYRSHCIPSMGSHCIPPVANAPSTTEQSSYLAYKPNSVRHSLTVDRLLAGTASGEGV